MPSRKLHIIDALGPFFLTQNRSATTINWSKIPFSELEEDFHLTGSTRQQILNNFRNYLEKVSAFGYDGISIDDLAHLTSFPFYNPRLSSLLRDYRMLYKELFSVAHSYNMKIFINTDYLFYNEGIRSHLKRHNLKPDDFFKEAIEQVLHTFPEIEGIILRIGENDGKDVSGNFLSHLLLRTPVQANELLQNILPIFEQHNKLLIFRTWSVGVHKIGDLMWNEHTFDAVFSSVGSDSLIISMKFGDTDFMRYLSLNPLFFRGKHKKIIELQTRREWEGMGTYPSFVGWDYAHYFKEIVSNENIVGMHVWCQTGGWAKSSWKNITYLKDSSLWNELNTEVTIALFKEDKSIESAVMTFCKKHNLTNVTAFLEFLRLSDIAIKKGLYIPDLAEKKLYLRRSRLPSVLWLTWDRILIQPTIIRLLRSIVRNRSKVIQDSREALKAIDKMITIAKELSFNKEALYSLEFERATLKVFIDIRRYIFTSLPHHEIELINRRVRAYEKNYPEHYSIPHLYHMKIETLIPKRVLGLFLRETTLYRKRDRVILATSPIQRKFVRYYLRKTHLIEQSMGIEVFFK